MLRVLLAVTSPATHEGLRALLEREHFEVIESPANGLEAARLTGALRPDVVILTQCAPQPGTDVASAIREAHPRMPVILLMHSATESEIRAALLAGVRGCLVDTEPAENVVRAVHDVLRGGAFLSSDVLCELFKPYVPTTRPGGNGRCES